MLLRLFACLEIIVLHCYSVTYPATLAYVTSGWNSYIDVVYSYLGICGLIEVTGIIIINSFQSDESGCGVPQVCWGHPILQF